MRAGWSFNNCKIDVDSFVENYIDVESFGNTTPVKEYGYYYKDGQPIYFTNIMVLLFPRLYQLIEIMVNTTK